jgi:hypothetical protein
MNVDWELFKIWLQIDDVDLDRLSWQQVDQAIKSFESEAKQNSFNYQRALKIYKR